MKIRQKLLFLWAGSAAAAGLVMAAISFPLIHSAVQERYVDRLKAETDLLSGWLAGQKADIDFQNRARDWGLSLDLRVTLIAANGGVLGDSSVSSERLTHLENHLSRPEIRAALAQGWGQAVHPSPTTGEDFFYLARRIDNHGPVAYLRIALPAWKVRQAESPYLVLIVLVAIVLPVLLTSLAYFGVRRWSRPIEALAQTASRIADGQISLPVPTPPYADELGRLGRSVERMRLALTGKISELELERQFLASVISEMKEGLLLVAEDGKVRLANKACWQIWNLKTDPSGKPLLEAIRHPKVRHAFDQVHQEGKEYRERIQDIGGSGRVFELHASPMASGPGGRAAAVLILFFDTTRLESLESVRKEFVANVSHELRTPLTSIKAAVLTLLENCDDPQARRRFLDTIHRNSERMTALVEDLTDLSLIETGAIKLDIRSVDLAALARDAVAQLAPRHSGMHLQIRFDLPDPFLIQADRRRVEQILVNLIDNAMKFNRPGGMVRIFGSCAEGQPVFGVEDTGIGIPSDQLDKVFHRFHRVDPGGSQELGGTGLGLAIVKHLVLLHGATIDIESELGQGSKFTVQFAAPK